MSPAFKKEPTGTDGLQKVPGYLKRQGVSQGNWQYAMHHNFELLMLPSFPWRVNFYGALFRQSIGYNRELAVRMVSDEVIEPLWPAGLLKVLAKHLKQACESAEVKLTDQEVRDATYLDPGNTRRLLQICEAQDGSILRCRLVGRDKHEAQRNLRRIIDGYLTAAQSIEQNLVVPMKDLAPAARLKSRGASLLFVLFNPNTPTRKALIRKADDPDLVKNDYVEGHYGGGLEFRLTANILQADFRKVFRRYKLPELDVDRLVSTCCDAVIAESPNLQMNLFEDQVSTESANGQTNTADSARRREEGAESSQSKKPGGHLAKDRNRPVPPPAAAARVSDAEASQIHDALTRALLYEPDEELARSILTGCRELQPGCTPMSVCEAIAAAGRELAKKIAKKRPVDNPSGLIKKMVLDTFTVPAKPRLVGKCYVCQADLREGEQVPVPGYRAGVIAHQRCLQPEGKARAAGHD